MRNFFLFHDEENCTNIEIIRELELFVEKYTYYLTSDLKKSRINLTLCLRNLVAIYLRNSERSITPNKII